MKPLVELMGELRERRQEGSVPVLCSRRSGVCTAAVVEEDVRRVSSSRPLPKEELWTKT